MGTIYLFTGENEYLLREERRQWLEEFAKKHGPENLLRLDGSQATVRTLLDEISVAPFLSAKRLVVIDGVPKFTKEEMQLLSNNIHPDCILLFCDPKPDKRLGGTKELLANATVKEFHPVSGKALHTWVRESMRMMGSSIDPDAITLLLSLVGDDQQVLSQEMKKLSAFAGDRMITSDDVQNLTVPSGEQEVWHLMNLLTRGESDAAITYTRSLLERGEDAFSLWNLLLWMLRMLTMVHASVQGGQTNPMRIAAELKIKYPTVQTLLQLSKKIEPMQLRQIVHQTAEDDVQLKTGGYRATTDASEELVALIERFILSFGKLREPARV